MKTIDFSFIIPVYNRPDEILELLESFSNLDGDSDFEIVIVEDGSEKRSEHHVNEFTEDLNIAYYYKTNSGPGDSRNYGMKSAKGNYFIILDSDVILPSDYLLQVKKALKQSFFDAYGGPDTVHQSFTSIQKAINFAMTSVITTGGIRGSGEQVGKFQPRSFNMGLSKAAFQASGGFGTIHPGEDPDLSLRLRQLGFRTTLIKKAYVYHKRRTSWPKFYKQVYKFGLVRPILNKWHPNSKSLIYWLPSLFSFGLISGLLLILVDFYLFIYLYLIYFSAAFVLALVSYKSMRVALMALLALGIQFFGYGFGFLKSIFKIKILSKSPREAFPELFYDQK